MLTERLKLDPDETITATVRKHWFVLLSQTLSLIIFAITPIALIVYAFANDFFDTFLLGTENVSEPAVFFASAWFLIMWMMICGAWTDYYLDMWTITTRRVIAIDQRGFFHRSIASFRLEKLQDLNIEINGIIATALDFGNLEAETASHDDAFTIRGIPKPRDVKALIQKAADERFTARSETQSSASVDDGV